MLGKEWLIELTARPLCTSFLAFRSCAEAASPLRRDPLPSNRNSSNCAVNARSRRSTYLDIVRTAKNNPNKRNRQRWLECQNLSTFFFKTQQQTFLDIYFCFLFRTISEYCAPRVRLHERRHVACFGIGPRSERRPTAFSFSPAAWQRPAIVGGSFVAAAAVVVAAGGWLQADVQNGAEGEVLHARAAVGFFREFFVRVAKQHLVVETALRAREREIGHWYDAHQFYYFQRKNDCNRSFKIDCASYFVSTSSLSSSFHNQSYRVFGLHIRRQRVQQV